VFVILNLLLTNGPAHNPTVTINVNNFRRLIKDKSKFYTVCFINAVLADPPFR